MDRLTELHYDGNGHFMKCSGSAACDGHCGNCDELGKIVDRLAAFEDLEMTPEAIEQQLTNFSSFLMEMTGGRMSKTNYTVQAMVSEANDHFESICDECADRQQLVEVEKELAKVKAELADMKELWDVLPVHIQGTAIAVRKSMKEREEFDRAVCALIMKEEEK